MIRVALSTCCLLPFFLPPLLLRHPYNPALTAFVPLPVTHHSLLVTLLLRHFITPSLLRTEPGDRVPGTWHPIPGTWSDPMDAPLRPPFGGFVSKMKPSLRGLGVRGDEGPHPRPRGLFPFLRLANPVYFPSLGQEGINEGGGGRLDGHFAYPVPRPIIVKIWDADPMCTFSRGRAQSSVLGVRPLASIRLRCRVPGARYPVPGTQYMALVFEKRAHGVCNLYRSSGGIVRKRNQPTI